MDDQKSPDAVLLALRAGLAERRKADDALLAEWLKNHPNVEVTERNISVGEWTGSVDGRDFLFKEGEFHWGIRVSSPSSGRSPSAPGKQRDSEAPDSTEPVESYTGGDITEGTIWTEGYSDSVRGRAEFILRVVNTYLLRERCTLHTTGRVDLERRLGERARWCPACGTLIDGR